MPLLKAKDICLFRYNQTGKHFAAIAYGDSNNPDYILNLSANQEVDKSTVNFVQLLFSATAVRKDLEDLPIKFDWLKSYGDSSGPRRISSANVLQNFEDFYIPDESDMDDYEDQEIGDNIAGWHRWVNTVAGDAECINVWTNSHDCWTHIGYIVDDKSDLTLFALAIDMADQADSDEKLKGHINSTTLQENAAMQSALQKGGEIASNLAQVNKDSMSVVAQLTAGGTALQIAINRIEQFIPADKRKQFKIYANTPLGKLAVANLLSVAQSQFMGASNKAKYIADGAVISAMNEVAQSLPIQQIVIDLFSGINVPEIQG